MVPLSLGQVPQAFEKAAGSIQMALQSCLVLSLPLFFLLITNNRDFLNQDAKSLDDVSKA